MSTVRPFVLSIAGHDPSAGAGLLADIKTFEAHQCYGLGVCTAITYQNDLHFEGLEWVSEEKIMQQLNTLLERFSPQAVKVGIVESFSLLEKLIGYLKERAPTLPIVLDPVLKASAGYTFHQAPNARLLEALASNLELITPNWKELHAFYPQCDVTAALQQLGRHTAVLLKGGHHPDPAQKGDDLLYIQGKKEVFSAAKNLNTPKHGSGCVLSAGIAARLALGTPLTEACRRAKAYTYAFLDSNDSLLGYHHSPIPQH